MDLIFYYFYCLFAEASLEIAVHHIITTMQCWSFQDL